MKKLCVLSSLSLCLLWLGLSTGCGVVGNIEGGPKDTSAPVFVRAMPDSGGVSVAVSNKKIFIYFNEFIQLNDPSKILINPLPRKNVPIISEDLRRIVIKYDTLLEAGTTYSFDFKNSIGDLNENNRLSNFYYLFSTGVQIDTQKFRGRILSAQTALPDSISRAFLYPAENFNDSTVLHQKAFYTAKANDKGYFEFQHLRPGKYYAFVFHDQDQDFKYSGVAESFDFLDTPIFLPKRDTLTDSIIPIFFTSAKAVTQKQNFSRTRKHNKWLLEYQRPEAVQIPTIPLKIIFHDSITEIDSTKIRLYDITAIKDSLRPYQNEYIVSMQVEKVADEPKNTQLSINMDLDFSQPYLLILDSAWVRDTNYVTAKTDTLRLEMLDAKQYRILKVICDSCAVKSPALNILKGGKLLYTLHAQDSLALDKTFLSPYLRTGSYELRIFEDFNLNKQQDIVDYKQRKHGERTFLLDKNSIDLPAVSSDNKSTDNSNPLIYEQHIRTRDF